MRAKRSKKYRKTMQQYQLSFGFREPYQVLVDSSLLLSLHAFSMPLLASLERTLHGKVKPFITKCCLSSLNELSASTKTRGRSPYLPPPEELPLRYCDHGERGPLSETECLLELVSGGMGASMTVLGEAKVGEPGAKVPRNKEHYIIATADPEVRYKYLPELSLSNSTPKAGMKRKRTTRTAEEDDGDGDQPHRRARKLPGGLRDYIRRVPGVPIIYVKRSVMILEELSAVSLGKRKREEKEKMAEGLSVDARKKLKLYSSKDEDEVAAPGRANAGNGDEGVEDGDGNTAEQDESVKKKRRKGPKGPNPLSVKRKKAKVRMPADYSRAGNGKGTATTTSGSIDDIKARVKRRRKHGGGDRKADVREEGGGGGHADD